MVLYPPISKKEGVNIIILDIDRRLNPDIVGSTLDLSFLDNIFDAVACYEVLEHLPYKNLGPVFTRARYSFLDDL